jgi:hypothetical protein
MGDWAALKPYCRSIKAKDSEAVRNTTKDHFAADTGRIQAKAAGSMVRRKQQSGK